MDNVSLLAISEALFERYGKEKPKNRAAHVQAVAEAILFHLNAGRQLSTFETGLKKMSATHGRRLFSNEWRLAHIYADLTIIENDPSIAA